MNKKLLSLLAVSTLSLGVLTACGSGEKNQKIQKLNNQLKYLLGQLQAQIILIPFLKDFRRMVLGLRPLIKT